jgi:hypothetical protein
MKKSTTAEISIKHLLNESQKSYHLSQLAQLLSVTGMILRITYIHNSYIWMASCPGVCSECER